MTGANQHLTYTDKNLVNVIDIFYLRIRVSHPNGTEALITKVARDNKFIVGFDESKCFLMAQDLMDVKLMGIGKQVNGLYYFNSQEGNLFKNNVPSSLNTKLNWHNRLGHPSDQCMRTRSQARSQNRRQQQITTVIVEEPEIPMAENRTMAQMLQAPIEGYQDAIVLPPINANNFELKQPLINLVQNIPKFRTLRLSFCFFLSLSKVKPEIGKEPPRTITNAPSSTSSPSNNSFEIQQMVALLEDKMNIRMSRLEKAISEKNATTPATVKAVEEVCVTCGSNHNFNNCPLT
ncbi:hypothetical protein Tco_0732973, partial [Tanacetum coccineum]